MWLCETIVLATMPETCESIYIPSAFDVGVGAMFLLYEQTFIVCVCFGMLAVTIAPFTSLFNCEFANGQTHILVYTHTHQIQLHAHHARIDRITVCNL